jgi:hypothetical protein
VTNADATRNAPAAPSRDDHGALEREAVRLFRRYQLEIVEAYDLCPWARVAREQGRVRERVLAASVADVADALAGIEALAADERVEIGILLFPRLEVSRPAFERFVTEVRERDAARCRPHAAVFAMAEFHPDAPAVLDPPGAFTSFVRRTPDPTLQLVRQSVLARIRKHDKAHGTGFLDISKFASLAEIEKSLGPADGPPIYERVLDQNRATFAAAGAARMDALFAALRDDRDRSYAALGAGLDRSDAPLRST